MLDFIEYTDLKEWSTINTVNVTKYTDMEEYDSLGCN